MSWLSCRHGAEGRAGLGGLAWRCSHLAGHSKSPSGPPFALWAERGSAEMGGTQLGGGRHWPSSMWAPLGPAQGAAPGVLRLRALLQAWSTSLWAGSSARAPSARGTISASLHPTPCPLAWLPPLSPLDPGLRAFAQAATLSQAFLGRQGSPDMVTAQTGPARPLFWPCQTTSGPRQGRTSARCPHAGPRAPLGQPCFPACL